MTIKEYTTGGSAVEDLSSSTEQFAHMSLALIVPSLTNPRKTFDQVKLRELADSIKSSGVHQPVLLRPLPGSRLAETSRTNGPRPTHELVAGERRFRASTMAGITTIPAMIRELTDAQALEIQIIENLQRDDLSVLEEAEGYEYLMQHTGITADLVGTKVGKSRSYVYARLKLLDLSQASRKALRDGTIDASKALLLARIPDEKLQGEALQKITETDWQGDVMGYREAASTIQRNYMLQLKQAVFKIDDANLLPAAGPCTACPKRTGAEPDLFKDVKSADVCTDPACFHKKEEAHSAQQVDKAREQGQTVIAGKEAQELAATGHQSKYKGYRRLDVAEDSPTDQPLRKIIGAQMKAEGISPVKIEHPKKKGELVDALPNDVVLRLLKTVEGQALAAKTVAKEVREFADEKKDKAEAKAKEQYEQGWRAQLLARTWSLLKDGDVNAFTQEVHRHLVLRDIRSLQPESVAALCDLLGVGKVGAYGGLIDFAKTTTSPDLLTLLVTMQRDVGAYDFTYDGANRINNAGLMLVAGNVFGSRLPTIISDVQAEAMDRYIPKTKSPKAPLPLAPAAQAEGVRGNDKATTGSKKQRPAAPAAKAKASKEETALGIAAALQGLESAAPAAEGSEPGADAQGIEASALADAGTSVRPAQDTLPATVYAGERVRVLATVTGNNANYAGSGGKVVKQQANGTWLVNLVGPSGRKFATASFAVEDLEVIE